MILGQLVSVQSREEILEEQRENAAYLHFVRELGAIKVITPSMARALINLGFHSLELRALARPRGVSAPPEQETAARGVYWKLKWYDDQLRAGAWDPAYSADLKKWVLQATIELRAAAEGQRHLRRIVGAFFTDVVEGLKTIPEKAGETLAEILTRFFKPLWPFLVVGAVGSMAGIFLQLGLHFREQRHAVRIAGSPAHRRRGLW